MTYTLIGAAVSLYTGKVRGYLRWKNVPFRERMATREVYKHEILPRVGWPVIPVVVHDDGSGSGVTLQDTTDIIDYGRTARARPLGLSGRSAPAPGGADPRAVRR